MYLQFKLTSRSRPKRLIETLDSIYNNLTNTELFSVQCTFDLDDTTTNNPEFIQKLNSYKRLTHYFGISNNKIHAINLNLEKLPKGWDVLCNVSDDQIFTVKGFDDIIRGDMPEDLDCFLHYPDGNHNTDILSTLSIVGRTYFERTNYIYHPDYVSVFSDQEETEKARLLGKHKFVNRQIFEHLHPVFKKAEWDEQYRSTENQEVYAKDRKTYFDRKRINFGI